MKKCRISVILITLLICILVYKNMTSSKIKNDIPREINLQGTYQILGVLSSKICEEYVLDPIVYDGMTMDELTKKLNASLNSNLTNKGNLIATYSLKVGVDPYLVTAIMLVETGCKWKCSNLVKKCNNVGGQVGSGCGKYKYYETLDDGIKGLIDYLYNGYISKGMTTAKQINSKYAANKSWHVSVNKYIENIKAQ